MDSKIRLLLVTDKPGQQHKLKGIFEKEGFNVVVTGDIGTATRFLFQDCQVVMCRALIDGIVPINFIEECQIYRIPLVAMGSNPAHFVPWRNLEVEHFFDTELLMGSGDSSQHELKKCVDVVRQFGNFWNR